MMVVWSTRLPAEDSRVMWSLQAGGPYIYFNGATTRTHDASALCGEPATTHGYYPPFYWHYAVISNLTPGVDMVYYKVGSDELNQWSEELGPFKASPPADANTEVHILLVADIGVSEFETGSTSRLNMPAADTTWSALASTALNASADISLLLHIGDIAYSCGYLIKWETYMAELTELGIATRIPYLLNQGNHERDYPNSGGGSDLYATSSDSGGECGVPTELRFPSPTNMSTVDGGWYTFIHGPALFVMMNSEARVDKDSPQYAFVRDALIAVDRTTTPWVIVASHRPMYYVYSKGGKIDPIFQVLEDLFVQYQVDVFVVGHVHNTYQSCPVYNATCVSPAYEGSYASVVHMGIGNAGVTPLDAVGNSTNTPSWVAYQASEYGYASMRINAKELEIYFHNNQTEIRFSSLLKRYSP